ncbi:MAG: biotin/lipoyl-binding protein, partial [Pseudomonadota bacterium]
MADPADNTADQASNSSNDKAALLNSLRIDRQAPAPRPSYRKWVVFAGGFVALVLFLWLVDLPRPQDPVPLRVSTAVAAAQLSTGSSVLDATGYVVARRQATVSSKTTGKVVEVMIEEGMQVNKDQLLARLDDSIPRAQYELAQSQLESSRAGLAELDIALQQAQLDLQRTENLADRS